MGDCCHDELQLVLGSGREIRRSRIARMHPSPKRPIGSIARRLASGNLAAESRGRLLGRQLNARGGPARALCAAVVMRRLFWGCGVFCFQGFHARPHIVAHHVLPDAREHSSEPWIGFCTLLDLLDVLVTMLTK